MKDINVLDVMIIIFCMVQHGRWTLTPGLAADFQLAYSSSDENYRAVMRTRYPTYHYDSTTGLYNINPNGVYDYEQYFCI